MMKKLLVITLLFAVPHVQAMDMDSAKKVEKKERTCADTCLTAAKACCLLGLAAYVVQNITQEPEIYDHSAVHVDKPCTWIKFNLRDGEPYCTDDGKYHWRYIETEDVDASELKRPCPELDIIPGKGIYCTDAQGESRWRYIEKKDASGDKKNPYDDYL